MDTENIFLQKKELRKKIALLKSYYTQEELLEQSEVIVAAVEKTNEFKRAKTILVYHSMPGEVYTHGLIKRHMQEKEFLLPVVRKDGLHLKKYISDNHLMVSSYGVYEPTGETFNDYQKIDLVIVPGVAFDQSLNRLGYGKAYYDGLLPKIDARKIAVCFDFQLFDSIPHSENDVKMDLIICQNKIIG